MVLQCEDGFLFHVWGSTGKCLRCGINAAFDLDLTYLAHPDRGMPSSEKLEDAQSEPALLSRARLVDRPSLCEDRDHVPDAPSADVSFACSRAYLVGLLPAFLRRHHRA